MRSEVRKSNGKENRSVGKGSPGAGKVLNDNGIALRCEEMLRRSKDCDALEMQVVVMALTRGAKELNCLEKALI